MSECVWGTCCGQLTLSMKFSLTKDRNLELRALENSAFIEKKKEIAKTQPSLTHPYGSKKITSRITYWWLCSVMALRLSSRRSMHGGGRKG